ncbi:hypothetical protein AB0O75_49825 [Streptomyces sp. NPDC088921]|uniref:hypothetical protein n=1 Tax=unclassified Streptomyces TaxID=2593676 RepID=UPI00343F629F
MDSEVGLVFDSRTADPGQRGRGVHAFVMGVSRYRGRSRGDLRDIPGTAVSAAEFTAFLREDFHDPTGVRLRTVRMLLSPVDEERPRLESAGVQATEATRANVKAALRAWQRDCDQNSENIGVLYLGGHGVTSTQGTRYVFLSEAHENPHNQYRFSVDIPACVEGLKQSRLHSLIVVSDCCAERVNRVPVSPGVAVAVYREDLNRDWFKTPACDLVLMVNAARTGTRGYALGSGEGTLLAVNLLRMLRGEAGELFGPRPKDRDFRVTDRGLKAKLQSAILDYLSLKSFRIDPDSLVIGEYLTTGITRPEPPPKFTVDFRPQDAQQQVAVEVRSARSDAPCWDGVISGPTPVPLPAGSYRVLSKVGSLPAYPVQLDVSEPVECVVGELP